MLVVNVALKRDDADLDDVLVSMVFDCFETNQFWTMKTFVQSDWVQSIWFLVANWPVWHTHFDLL